MIKYSIFRIFLRTHYTTLRRARICFIAQDYRLKKTPHCDLKHIFARNKAYLCRARMKRWWESAGELREFHLDRDGMSLAE
jgi:hypothetical protein